jgi:NADH-quinone oxidoreductase subunit N
MGIAVLVFLTLGISSGSRAPRQPAAYAASLLFAATGFLLMAAAQQLLLVFLALELASLSLYIITGFDRSRPDSAEAALKYFLFGGVAAAFLLFGFSLIYGVTGSLELPRIAVQMVVQDSNPLLRVAMVMVLVGFGFKVAAAPFHLWAPDAYQGAPAPSAALIASASKLASFTLFARLIWQGIDAYPGSSVLGSGWPSWFPAVVALSAASLILGNLAALAQSNLKRLLAYSAIAHAGAMMLGVIAVDRVGPSPLFYYAFTYGLATVGAFGVIAVAERAGPCSAITDLAGLFRRSPLLAGCLGIFVLSLAGIPPLSGFFGKFLVFSSALLLGGPTRPAGVLAILAIAMSAVSLYYYLKVLKQALVAEPPPAADPIRVPVAAAAALIACAMLVVAFGVAPGLLLGMF